MKFFDSLLNYQIVWVAPFVGAWIEINAVKGISGMSAVAPFVGAWIEICEKGNDTSLDFVAPFVGAWIEIIEYQDSGHGVVGRSLRGSVD